MNEIEDIRNNDRSSHSWYEMKSIKEVKIKAKEKINETKQKLFGTKNLYAQKRD